MAAGVMDCGRRLLQEVCDAQLHIYKLLHQTQGVRNSKKSCLFHDLSCVNGVNLILFLHSLKKEFYFQVSFGFK